MTPHRREGRRLARKAYGRQVHVWLGISVDVVAGPHGLSTELRWVLAKMIWQNRTEEDTLADTDLPWYQKALLPILAKDAQKLRVHIHEPSCDMH